MKYIEFFFCNFWHWLGLAIIIGLMFGRIGIYTDQRKDKKEE